MWMVVGAIGPVVMTMVWFAVLGERDQIGGYGQSDFILYYLLTTVGWYIVGGSFDRVLGRAIKDGDITKSLLQPYNIVLGKAVWEQAWKVLSLLLSLPIVGLIIFLVKDKVQWGWNWSDTPSLILSLLAGALVFALMQAIIGTMAFWVVEVWPYSEMNEMLLNLLGGLMAPIALLPSSVQVVTMYLPFRYVFYEPVSIVLGKTTNVVDVLMRQWLWVGVLWVMYKLLWRAGIKKYEAVGS